MTLPTQLLTPVASSLRFWRIAFAALFTATFVGCGGSNLPDTAEVTGVVTVDGEPVENASVMFAPVEAGRPAVGSTDAQGHYTLMFTSELRGAPIGENKIFLSTASKEKKADDGTIIQEARPELIPAEFTDGSQTRDVKPGQNVINFELSQ